MQRLPPILTVAPKSEGISEELPLSRTPVARESAVVALNNFTGSRTSMRGHFDSDIFNAFRLISEGRCSSNGSPNIASQSSDIGIRSGVTDELRYYIPHLVRGIQDECRADFPSFSQRALCIVSVVRFVCMDSSLTYMYVGYKSVQLQTYTYATCSWAHPPPPLPHCDLVRTHVHGHNCWI